MANKKTQAKGPGNINIAYMQIGTTLRRKHFYQVFEIIFDKEPEGRNHKRKAISKIFLGKDYKKHVFKEYPRKDGNIELNYEIHHIPYAPGKHTLTQ